MILDTGSSDLWLPATGVKCVRPDGTSQGVEACGFGPLADNTFGIDRIADQNFNIAYLDGRYVTGVLGYEDVGVGNITVKHQEVALIDHAYWQGNGVTSGLIGFGYPSMTSAFHGTDPALDDDKESSAARYTPWIFNAIANDLIPHMFSLAIERGANGGGGQLALGGLPSVTFDNTWASTPLRMMDVKTGSIQGAKNYSYYAMVRTPTIRTLRPGARRQLLLNCRTC